MIKSNPGLGRCTQTSTARGLSTSCSDKNFALLSIEPWDSCQLFVIFCEKNQAISATMSLTRSAFRLSPNFQALLRQSGRLSRTSHSFQGNHRQLWRSYKSLTTMRSFQSSHLLPPTSATQRTYSTGQEADGSAPMPGFSYPGPRKLSEIVKIQLLNKHGAPRVREIWNEYHKDHKSAVGDTLSSEEYGLLLQRTQRCKHFVFPVPR